MSGNDMEHSLAQKTTSDNDSNVTRSIPFEDWAQQTDTTQHPLPLTLFSNACVANQRKSDYTNLTDMVIFSVTKSSARAAYT